MKTLHTLGALIVALIAAICLLIVIASESGEVVVITTRDTAEGAQQTRLWVVDHDGDAWLRAGSPASGWFRRITANPNITVQRGENSFSALAEPATDATETINALMDEKYGWADDCIDLFFGRDDAIAIRLVANPDSG